MTAVSAKALESFGFADVFKQIFHLPAGFFRCLCHAFVTAGIKTRLNYSKAIILQL